MPILFPIESRQAMPWKNGGGSTTEILVWPQGADFANFDWRISLATIASPGPFSSFPDIDRSLSLVSGAGVDLQIEENGQRQDIALRAPNAAGESEAQQQATIAFPGEALVVARLVNGESTDFNVMTRRSKCRHTFSRFVLQGERGWTLVEGAINLLFLAAAATDAKLICSAGMNEYRLGLHDCLMFEASDKNAWQLYSESAITVFAMQIFTAQDQSISE